MTAARVESIKTYSNTSSVHFDAVFIPGGKGSIEMLKGIPDALHFVDEAFKHGKAIAASGAGVDFVKATKTGELATDDVAEGQGVLLGSNAEGLVAAFIKAIAYHRFHNRAVDQVRA